MRSRPSGASSTSPASTQAFFVRLAAVDRARECRERIGLVGKAERRRQNAQPHVEFERRRSEERLHVGLVIGENAEKMHPVERSVGFEVLAENAAFQEPPFRRPQKDVEHIDRFARDAVNVAHEAAGQYEGENAGAPAVIRRYVAAQTALKPENVAVQAPVLDRFALALLHVAAFAQKDVAKALVTAGVHPG